MSRADDLYGSNDINRLFPDGSPITTAPFRQAGRRKDRQDFDVSLIHQALADPNRKLEDVDPRTLSARQPSVTRAGVSHYLSPQFAESGELYAKNDSALNDVPVVYERDNGDRVAINAHHRATAALIQGQPHRAVVVRGPWGPVRGR